VLVIINTSDLPGMRISGSYTNRRWWIFSCQFFHHDVESVDPLSINETYESIAADTPDNDRRPSRAHLCRHPENRVPHIQALSQNKDQCVHLRAAT
jgi:hypothetical protein